MKPVSIVFVLVYSVCLASCLPTTIDVETFRTVPKSTNSNHSAELSLPDFHCSLKGHVYTCCGGAVGHEVCISVGVEKKDEKDYFEILVKYDGKTKFEKSMPVESERMCFKIPVHFISAQGCLKIKDVDFKNDSVHACLAAEFDVSNKTRYSQNLGCYDYPLPAVHHVESSLIQLLQTYGNDTSNVTSEGTIETGLKLANSNYYAAELTGFHFHCSHSGHTYTCCGRAFSHEVCVSVGVEKKDEKDYFEVIMKYDGKTKFDKSMPVESEHMCVYLPIPFISVKGCLKIKDVDVEENSVHACFEADFVVSGATAFSQNLGCYDFALLSGYLVENTLILLLETFGNNTSNATSMETIETELNSDNSNGSAELKSSHFHCSLNGLTYTCCGQAIGHELCISVGVEEKDEKDYFEILIKYDGKTKFEKSIPVESAGMCFNIPFHFFTAQSCLNIEDVEFKDNSVHACLAAEFVISNKTRFSQSLGCYDFPLPSAQNVESTLIQLMQTFENNTSYVTSERALETGLKPANSYDSAELKLSHFHCSLNGHTYSCSGRAFSHEVCISVGMEKKDGKDYSEVIITYDGKTEFEKSMPVESAHMCVNLPVPVISVQGCLKIKDVDVKENSIHACLEADFKVSGATSYSHNLGCYDFPLPSGQHAERTLLLLLQIYGNNTSTDTFLLN